MHVGRLGGPNTGQLEAHLSADQSEGRRSPLTTLLRFTDATADCPNLIKRVKTGIERNLAGVGYSKYANFPSCSGLVLLTKTT